MVRTLHAARRALEEGRPVVLATIIDGPGTGQRALFDSAGLVVEELPESVFDAVAADAAELLIQERSRTLTYGESRVFLEALMPPPRLVIVGAGHAGEALAALATPVGFGVVICDPRSALSAAERFPEGAEIIVAWPHEVVDRLSLDGRTAVVLLSHDVRVEDPLLPLLLDSGVFYIGAMGSRRTHAARLDRLRSTGRTDDELDRIHGPVGLDIGAETPEEMAIAILAEVLLVRSRAGTGLPLQGIDEPIQRRGRQQIE